MQLELNLSELKKEIKPSDKNIFIQLPEGLKTKISELKKAFPKSNLFFSIDTSYGACDLQEHLAKKVNADLIIHFGHTEFSSYKKNKIIYWPTYYSATNSEINDLIKKIETHFEKKKLFFVYPIQYKLIVEKIKTILKKKNNVNIISGLKNNRIKNDGQILGCDVSTLPKKNIDVILYFGDGFFHPYALDKKILTYRIFPFEEIIEIKKDTNKLINMLPFMIKDKKVFGIFISSKLGQSKLDLALKIKKLLEKNKKEVYLLTGDNVNYEKLIGLNLEVLVNTACPRIIDDYKNYKVILVNPETILNTFK